MKDWVQNFVLGLLQKMVTGSMKILVGRLFICNSKLHVQPDISMNDNDILENSPKKIYALIG